MIVREVLKEEKKQFNQAATHPLQSWEWGEFRQKTGRKVIRLGAFEGKTLKTAYQLTVHPLPKFNYTALYFPKGPKPDKTMIEALKKVGEKEKAIFIKMEPNVKADPKVVEFLTKEGCQKGRPLFTKYTFQLDLKKKEEQLLAEMKPKTRYNIKVAQKHGVEIKEDNSPQAFEEYLKLTTETTRRQKFYAHSADYHRQMWQVMRSSGMAHLFTAKYQGQILATYIFFIFNRVLYYPYGASTREHREAMPTYALFWEVIKFGQKMGCQLFDMWGTPGPKPSPRDPYFGFHRFKEGFGAQLVEFLGTYDLIINPTLYKLFNLANKLRWVFLHSKTASF
ncbi:peptidoglycan bridge formation glycyltransferase FemA/FemB family protein [Candidatus Shapirobacteria bacterium]|nr:peptidoglycan bridge formation glycyltransferase FemA/FemB family protein [Candidatus Shapirobacteria bacterium]